MKKILSTALLLGVTTLGLVACEPPEGVDQNFWTQAKKQFVEIDEDTMEMENSDRQDLANFQLVKASANSNREVQFAKALEAMLKTQDSVINNDGDALANYLKARSVAMESMEFSDTEDAEYDHDVPAFEFIEETD